MWGHTEEVPGRSDTDDLENEDVSEASRLQSQSSEPKSAGTGGSRAGFLQQRERRSFWGAFKDGKTLRAAAVVRESLASSALHILELSIWPSNEC